MELPLYKGISWVSTTCLDTTDHYLNDQTWGIRIQYSYSSVFDYIFFLRIHVYSVFIKKYEYKYSYCIQILF